MEEMMMYGETTVNTNQAVADVARKILVESVQRGKIPVHRIGKLQRLIDSLDMENIKMALAIIKRYEGEKSNSA
jgi:hypothetical protein